MATVPAADLRAVYEKLSTQLVLREQKTEVTAYLTLVAAMLSRGGWPLAPLDSTLAPFASLATTHQLVAADHRLGTGVRMQTASLHRRAPGRLTESRR
jgi:hypothetical protein